MLLTLLQFFATKFLFLALHLESGCFPRPLTAREEAAAFSVRSQPGKKPPLSAPCTPEMLPPGKS